MLFFAAISGVLLVLWLIFGEDFDLDQSSNQAEAQKEEEK